MPAWLLPAIMGGSALLSAYGQSRGGRSRGAVPRDVAPLRAQQLDMLSRFLSNPDQASSFFFGAPSDLQRKTRSGIDAFLSQPAPETRAFDFARPILEGMLSGAGPQFERDIAMANQSGGRFGSANAIMRGEAFRNLYNQRSQTAGTLGMLAQSAGAGPWSRLLAGGEFADRDMDRRAALLSGLFGMSGQATLGLPITQQPSIWQSIGQGGMDLSQHLMLWSQFGGGGTSSSGGGRG